jgi:hypothetical protein
MVKEQKQPEKKIEKEGIGIGGISIKNIRLTLIGTSPLICHKFSDRMQDAMLAKQMKTATGKVGREAKIPQRDYEESLYVLKDGRYGFPISGFKNAAVDACSFMEGTKKTVMRGAFHIVDEHEGLAVIVGTPHMRKDNVRVGMGTADIRYRGEFPTGWKTTLVIRMNENAVSVPQLAQLFNAAGFGVGVGDWRPQKDGSYGQFEVVSGG